MSLSREQWKERLGKLAGKRVAVVGDIMIDRYYWGSVHRVSPEAPVPVVDVESESVRLGGAANVANNIKALGGVPALVGLVGDDHPAATVKAMLEEQNLSTDGLISDPLRPTTIKTRVIAAGQHVVRVDYESKTDCPDHLIHRIVDAVKYGIQSLDAILIEDYNKGVVTRSIIQELTALAEKYGKVITVDPKFNNFLEYKHVTVFKPNRREVEEVLGGRLESEGEVLHAGKRLLDLLGARNVLLTRGDQGMSLFESDGSVTHIKTSAENIQDVSGAGDTVISTLTLALASGMPVREACLLSNCAAGVVVGSVGIIPITPDQLLEAAVRCPHHEGGVR